MIFSPSTLQPTGNEIILGLLVALVLVFEGEGYVLVMLGAYLQGKAFLFPKSVNAPNHRQGYVIGLKRTLKIYLVVLVTLAMAALYEAGMAILVLPFIV